MKKALAIAAVIAMLAVFAGCGEKEVITIEKFMTQNPEVAASIDKTLEDADYKGADVSVEYKGDCCIITLKYEETFSEDKVGNLAEAFDKNSADVDELCESMLKTISDGTTFADPSAKMQILNGDGTEIWSKDYKM